MFRLFFLLVLLFSPAFAAQYYVCGEEDSVHLFSTGESCRSFTIDNEGDDLGLLPLDDSCRSPNVDAILAHYAIDVSLNKTSAYQRYRAVNDALSACWFKERSPFSFPQTMNFPYDSVLETVIGIQSIWHKAQSYFQGQVMLQKDIDYYITWVIYDWKADLGPSVWFNFNDELFSDKTVSLVTSMLREELMHFARTPTTASTDSMSWKIVYRYPNGKNNTRSLERRYSTLELCKEKAQQANTFMKFYSEQSVRHYDCVRTNWCAKYINIWRPCAYETLRFAVENCNLDAYGEASGKFVAAHDAYETCAARWHKDASFTLLTAVDILYMPQTTLCIFAILLAWLCILCKHEFPPNPFVKVVG